MRALLCVAACLALGCAGDRAVEVEICAAGVQREYAVAEARIPLADGERIHAATENGEPIRLQADSENGSGVLLTVELPGTTAADACRSIEIAVTARPAPPLDVEPVWVERIDDYQGEQAFRIQAELMTYVYHVGGSGFASLLDREANDWISYRPEGGFEGHFRGIPNIAPPQFHPGRPEGKKLSRILAQGPLKKTILSETEDGLWRLRWDVFPRYARMTLLSKGSEPYWILYEGTPGGEFDPETDFWFNSAGERMPMPEPNEYWNGRLPDPQWVYFGDENLQRALFLALHEPDDHWDEFWHRGPGGMTVFGFGRGPKPQWQYLDQSPATLTIGLIEDVEFSAAKRAIESAWRPLEVTVR